MRQYRILTDSIQIKNPFIINIGVNYDVITRPNYNSYEVLLRCNERLIELMKNDNMQIAGPIVLSTLIVELDKIDGVQSVENFEVVNLTDSDSGYSPYAYSIENATRNGIIYPSLDPCIFEVKYPRQDIRGRVVDM